VILINFCGVSNVVTRCHTSRDSTESQVFVSRRLIIRNNISQHLRRRRAFVVRDQIRQLVKLYVVVKVEVLQASQLLLGNACQSERALTSDAEYRARLTTDRRSTTTPSVSESFRQ